MGLLRLLAEATAAARLCVVEKGGEVGAVGGVCGVEVWGDAKCQRALRNCHWLLRFMRQHTTPTIARTQLAS